MKNLLIDTNIYTYALNGETKIIQILQRAQKISICSISIGELLSGFKAGSKENRNSELAMQAAGARGLDGLIECGVQQGTSPIAVVCNGQKPADSSHAQAGRVDRFP